MRGFAFGIIAGIAAVFGTIAAAFVALSMASPASLPAPALTIMVHMDEKLRFMRRHPTIDPHVLVVGSSIAWRQVAGAAFEKRTGRGHFLNGGTANLKIHQSRDLIDFYLANYDKVQTIIFMTGLPDFDDCSKTPADILYENDAAAYAFDHWPTVYFYFRYFAPQRYVNTAMTLAERTRPLTGDLYLDRYGSGPLQVPDSMKRGLRYGAIDPDPACIDAFVALSHSLAERKVHLVVIFPPINPDYLASYPETAKWTRETASTLAERTNTDGTEVITMFDAAFAPADFYDAFHLQWPAVQRLSTQLVASVVSTAATPVPGMAAPSSIPSSASASNESAATAP